MDKKSENFCQIFEQNIPTLKKDILVAFNKYESKGGYKVVWEEFEDVIDEPLTQFLKAHFSSPVEIERAKSKSVFPDWKVKWRGKIYAIDVKSGENVMDPWYDMGRLDTFEEKHIKKYEQEYYITIKWKKETVRIVVLDVFITPFYHCMGCDSSSGGVKFRPYDGKLRPKKWDDFEAGKCYWETKTDFLEGLSKSKKYRRIILACGWAQEMTLEEIEVFFHKIEKIKIFKKN